MKIKRVFKESFSVIGKLGSTKDGDDFIKQLWLDANSNFNEIIEFVKKDENNNLIGIWGLMGDSENSLNPWKENFTRGYYLAGVEVNDDCQEIDGWVKWSVPSYEYLVVKGSGEEIFQKIIQYIKDNDLKLVAAVFDYIEPKSQVNYMYFPIKTFDNE